MSLQATSPATPNAISSPASASGPTLSVVPAGRTSGPSGPDPALASLSARQAQERGLLTSGTYGRSGFISSASAALMLSLASRLRARTACCGSIFYSTTFKERATPSGRRIPALRASVRRTSANDLGSPLGSWGTPTTSEAGGTPEAFLHRKEALGGRCGVSLTALNLQAVLAAWPTPTTPSGGQTVPEGTTATGRRPNGTKATVTLGNVATLSTWPTPKSSDVANGWLGHIDGRRSNLNDTVLLASPWATPANRDYRTPNLKPYSERGGGAKGEQLNNQVVHSGPILTGSSAEIANGARLNPAHSRWLMGLPPVWDACAPTETRSTRRTSPAASAISSRRRQPASLLAWALAA